MAQLRKAVPRQFMDAGDSGFLGRGNGGRSTVFCREDGCCVARFQIPQFDMGAVAEGFVDTGLALAEGRRAILFGGYRSNAVSSQTFEMSLK